MADRRDRNDPPSPRRGGVGGGVESLAELRAKRSLPTKHNSTITLWIIPPPLTPPRKGEGNPSRRH